jgi:GNAT superfamily N-acetyltransferase
MELVVTTVARRPELVRPVAEMLWHEFGQPRGRTLADAAAYVQARIAAAEPCFALLADGVPVGTASLVAHDLDERPDLTPWLASVCVTPEARGRGYAPLLVKTVEIAARGNGVRTLWLYTWGAADLYAGLGWLRVDTAKDGPYDVVIMRKDFGAPCRSA